MNRKGVRIMSGAVVTALTAALLAFDSLTETAWPLHALVSVLVVAGLFELLRLAERSGTPARTWLTAGLGGVLVILHWSAIASGGPSNVPFASLSRELSSLAVMGGGLVAATTVLIFVEFVSQRPGALQRVAVGVFGLVYIWLFGMFVLKIRFLGEGSEMVVLLIAVAKLGDMGAYFIGSAFGRRKLAPRLSPGKTIIGSLAGLGTSIIAAVLVWLALGIHLLSFGHVVLFGLVIGVLAQLGDLAESLLKRSAEMKDSGGVLPGYGGVLDLIDSLLFSAPAAYMFLLWARR